MRNASPIDRVFADVIRVFPLACSPLGRWRQATSLTLASSNFRDVDSGLPIEKAKRERRVVGRPPDATLTCPGQ